jgi:hypothetical protein
MWPFFWWYGLWYADFAWIRVKRWTEILIRACMLVVRKKVLYMGEIGRFLMPETLEVAQRCLGCTVSGPVNEERDNTSS